MNEILYIKDTEVINIQFGKKLIEKDLLGQQLMVRGYKDPKYWTSEQIKIKQPQIVGFLEVNKTAELGLTTKWTSYKVF